MESDSKFQIEQMLVDASDGSFCCSIDDLNKLNIIINDDNCGNELFFKTCDCLRNDGLVFTQTSESSNLDKENSIVITLDQLYSSGEGTIVFAPHSKVGDGSSDALALSMQAALRENRFDDCSVSCGVIGYRKDDAGNVLSLIPTRTEENISNYGSTNFVTLAFGTKKISAEVLSKIIKSGLARYNYFIKTGKSADGLIYRTYNGEASTTIGMETNDSSDHKLYGQAVVNSEIENIPSFKPDIPFEIENKGFSR